MILVDVYVPSVDESWDFMIDENTRIDKVIQELTEIISRRTRRDTVAEHEGFMLYSAVEGEALPGDESLASCGIRDGWRLLLV